MLSTLSALGLIKPVDSVKQYYCTAEFYFYYCFTTILLSKYETWETKHTQKNKSIKFPWVFVLVLNKNSGIIVQNRVFLWFKALCVQCIFTENLSLSEY